MRHFHAEDELYPQNGARLCLGIGAQVFKHVQCLLHRRVRQLSGVAIAGADGRIEYTNPRFGVLTHTAEHDLTGQPLSAFNANPTACSDVATSGEHAKRRADGSVYWAMESTSPVRDASGNITHYIAIHNDTTEQRTLRAEVDYRAQYDHCW